MSEKKNGFDPQKMDEGELNRRLYEKRVKNFTFIDVSAAFRVTH